MRKLPLPVGNSIDAVQLLYDPDVSERELSIFGERAVEIVGTIADRYGSSAELCDSTATCPSVILEPIGDVNSNLINDTYAQMSSNTISSLQAVDQMAVAIKLRFTQKTNSEASMHSASEDEQILHVLEKATDDLLEQDSLQASRVRNQIISTTASTISDATGMHAGDVGIANKALSVTKMALKNMIGSDNVEQRNEIVTHTVSVFGGVSQRLVSSETLNTDHETRLHQTLRTSLKTLADDFCVALTADTLPGDEATGSSSQDFEFTCQKALTRPSVSTTPQMAIVGLGVKPFRVVHLKAPRNVLEYRKSVPTDPTRRQLTTSCKELPTAEVRLLMIESFEAPTRLMVKQRLDIPAHAFECGEYRARQAGGELSLPTGASPAAILYSLKIDGGKLQKFYTAVMGSQDTLSAVFTIGATATGPTTQVDFGHYDNIETSRTSVTSTMQWKESLNAADYFPNYNSVIQPPGQENFYNMSPTCLATILSVLALVLLFSALIAHALWRQNLPQNRERYHDQLLRLYLEEGNIDPLAYPLSVGERVSFGEHRCCCFCCICWNDC